MNRSPTIHDQLAPDCRTIEVHGAINDIAPAIMAARIASLPTCLAHDIVDVDRL